MNGAMYFIEMAANGGKGLAGNKAGAKFGTGYCDAQCPHETWKIWDPKIVRKVVIVDLIVSKIW